MQRIVIVGCSGAGKSTLARQLGLRLGLPVIHLDAQFWQPGWVMSSDDEEQAILARLLAGEAWIIDGNYGATMPQRFAAADTILFLDFPRWLCLWRIMRRWWQYRGKTRPDMQEGCPERLDIGFLKWVWNYRKTQRQRVLQLIEAHRFGRTVVVLQHPREAAALLFASKTSAPSLKMP